MGVPRPASVSGAIGLFAIAKFAGHRLGVLRGERLGIVLCAILNLALWNILVLYGIDLMNSGRAAILAYTMPLWATLTGAFLLREGFGPPSTGPGLGNVRDGAAVFRRRPGAGAFASRPALGDRRRDVRGPAPHWSNTTTSPCR